MLDMVPCGTQIKGIRLKQQKNLGASLVTGVFVGWKATSGLQPVQLPLWATDRARQRIGQMLV